MSGIKAALTGVAAGPKAFGSLWALLPSARGAATRLVTLCVWPLWAQDRVCRNIKAETFRNGCGPVTARLMETSHVSHFQASLVGMGKGRSPSYVLV